MIEPEVSVSRDEQRRKMVRDRRWPICPRCSTQLLDPLQHGHVQIDRCRRCGGLWFEHGELRRVLGKGDSSGAVTSLLRETSERTLGAETRHRCADCGDRLWRHDLDKTGLSVELCGECGGMWLKNGVLERLEHIKEGENARKVIDQPTTGGDWAFEFFSGMPVEFNIRPRRFPVVTVSLLAINVLVFFFMAVSGGVESYLDTFAVVASEFPGGSWWFTLFTAQFLHAGVIHLAGNMYFLYILGDNVEDVFGRFRFLVFYLFCGCFAGFAQTLASYGTDIPMVGASGAIAGLAAAYVVIFRRARITFMVLAWQTKISIIWYFGIWVAFNALGAATDAFGVGWFAHLGGFVAGLAIAAAVYSRVVAANPVLAYINEGAYLADRFTRGWRRYRRRRKRVG